MDGVKKVVYSFWEGLKIGFYIWGAIILFNAFLAKIGLAVALVLPAWLVWAGEPFIMGSILGVFAVIKDFFYPKKE